MLRLPVAFFASGAAALLFEVLLFRALGRVLGNTVWAAAIVLAAFMLGVAIGGLVAARLRLAHPARGFAAAELVVALTGSLLVWLLPAAETLAGRWLGPVVDAPALEAALRLVAALALLLPPTIAMGVTLPLGVRALGGRDTAATLGILYGANTLGACLAPLLAEHALIGALGLRGTALAAAALNLAAASLAFFHSSPAAPSQASAAPQGQTRLLVAAALAGALALALEVIWFRLLVLHAYGTDATFATMLALLLAGIALGGLLAPRLARVSLVSVAAAGAVAVVLGYWLAAPGRQDIGLVRYAAALMLPAALASGALFTLLGAALEARTGDVQAAVGRLAFANTLGGAFGALLGGFVLLPRIGIEASLFALAAGYVLLCLLVSERGARYAPLAVALAALAVFPHGRMKAHLEEAAAPYKRVDRSTTVRVTEGPTTTLQVLRSDHFGETATWRLLTDSYSMSGIDLVAMRYMHLYAWLPASLHPAPKRALLISYGAGNTASALLETPELESLTVVDVSPEILAASPLLHPQANPLQDPRTRLVLEDGRHFLFTRSERFDLITGEPPPPMMAGVVNLYTREYFRAMAAHLAPGGLATYWLPVHQMEVAGARATINAFCDAFPDCTLWAGSGYNWMLMGGGGSAARPALAHFARLWEQPASARRLKASGFEHPAQLGATFLGDSAQLREWAKSATILVDDFPKRFGAPPRDVRIEDYAAWMNTDAARERFAASAWIAAHWPRELVGPSRAFFAVQPIVNGDVRVDLVARLPLLDWVLRETSLQVPVYWLLDSDLREREIVEGKRDARPEYAYPRGVIALAERNFAGAAALFAADRQRDGSGALAAYALCRAGRKAEAAKTRDADLLPAALRCF